MPSCEECEKISTRLGPLAAAASKLRLTLCLCSLARHAHDVCARLAQESSWDPPPEWQENLAAEDYYSSTYENRGPNNDGGVADLQQLGGSPVDGDESNEEGGTSHYAPPQETALESVPTGAAGSASIVQPEGREGYDGNDGAAAIGMRSERDSQAQENDTHGDMASAGPRSSGDSSSLDQTSADEFSQWSLEKLRGVSKVENGLP